MKHDGIILLNWSRLFLSLENYVVAKQMMTCSYDVITTSPILVSLRVLVLYLARKLFGCCYGDCRDWFSCWSAVITFCHVAAVETTGSSQNMSSIKAKHGLHTRTSWSYPNAGILKKKACLDHQNGPMMFTITARVIYYLSHSKHVS